MRIIKIITLIFITSLLFIACSEDDNEDPETGKGTGTLTIKGIEYLLVEGTIYKNTERVSSPYNFDFDLKTSTINNIFQLVAFEMYTATNDDLQSGTYNHATNETSPAGTFCGLVFMNMNTITEKSEYAYQTKSGTVLVNRSDSEYELTINVIADKYEKVIGYDDWIITESDVVITCYYIGSLKKDEH